jgi:hypothetical protein
LGDVARRASRRLGSPGKAWKTNRKYCSLLRNAECVLLIPELGEGHNRQKSQGWANGILKEWRAGLMGNVRIFNPDWQRLMRDGADL